MGQSGSFSRVANVDPWKLRFRKGTASAVRSASKPALAAEGRFLRSPPRRLSFANCTHKKMAPLLPRGRFSLPTIATALILLAASAKADTEYYRHIFFDNSLTSDAYFYSSGKASAPSSLALTNGKIPIDSKVSFTPPNALHLEWKAVQNGGWDARIDVIRFRNREINFSGSNLFLWCYAPEGISAVALPVLRLVDTNAQFSAPLRLPAFTGDLPPQSWVQIKIPLERFSAASLHGLDPHRLQSIIFSQGTADNTAHTLIIDEIKIDGDAAARLGRHTR